MKSLPKRSSAEFQCRLTPALAGVTPKLKPREFQCRLTPADAGITPKLKPCPDETTGETISHSTRLSKDGNQVAGYKLSKDDSQVIGYAHGGATRQRGLVLFFALIALVAMSLAAVALIRSVDTSTMIAGNLAFKQAATTSGDAGMETAISWLSTTETTNSAKNVLTDPTHAFNLTCLVVRAPGTANATDPGCPAVIPGYHSSADPALNLTADATWNATNHVVVGTDGSGNTISYIIQRMCRNANQPVQSANCLFSSAVEDKNGQNIPLPQDICTGDGCPVAGQTPQIRITARTTGPRNTVSYIQSFVY